MTVSIIPRQMALVDQLCIYLPLPLMIESDHLPPITIDDRTRPHKRACYTPDMISDTISVASQNYFSTFTTPSDSLDLIPSDYLNTLHIMRMDVHV